MKTYNVLLVEAVCRIGQEVERIPIVEERAAVYNSRFTKPKRLIEKVNEQPEAVIREVFSEVTLEDLHEDLLPAWLRVAVMNIESLYSDDDSREILYEFYEQLLLFIEALYVLYEVPTEHEACCSSEVQLVEPRQVVAAFFKQFSIEYIRRELHDFLDAGVGYAGVYPNGFTPWQAWMVYNHAVCLVEAAWRVYGCSNKQLDASVLLHKDQVVNCVKGLE